jgi:hypothetical protein
MIERISTSSYHRPSVGAQYIEPLLLGQPLHRIFERKIQEHFIIGQPEAPGSLWGCLSMPRVREGIQQELAAADSENGWLIGD